MKALLIILFAVIYLKEGLFIIHSTTKKPGTIKPIICYDCVRDKDIKCLETETCNSTSGYCHLIIREEHDILQIVRTCAVNCGFPTSSFIASENYIAVCCSSDYCNSINDEHGERQRNHANIPVLGFITSFLWAHFSIILQYVGLQV